MRIERIICDRCGRESESSSSWEFVMQYDLCPICYREYVNFTDNQAEARQQFLTSKKVKIS